jgi:hypothetical protein
MCRAVEVTPLARTLAQRLEEFGARWLSRDWLTHGVSTCRAALDDALADLVIAQRAEYMAPGYYRLAGMRINLPNEGAVMGEQVYRLEETRKQVTDLLRSQGAMRAGAIAMMLRLPLWAVAAALESAVTAKLVVYVPTEGYTVAVAPVVAQPGAVKPDRTDWSAA